MNRANPDPAERPSGVWPGTVGALLRPLLGPPGPPPSCAGSLSRKTRVGGVENRKCPGAPETFPRSAPAGAALRPRPSTERWVAGQPARAAGGFGSAQNRPCIAPTSCAGNLPARPPPFLPPLLASRNPCPWHYVHLSGSHDTLVPTCFEAKLHRKGSGPTPGATATLAERASPAMATYTYTSRPRALPSQRRRYRDDLMQQ